LRLGWGGGRWLSARCARRRGGRFLTAPGARIASMTPKVSRVVARKTIAASIMAELSLNMPAKMSERESIGSDLEVHEPVHDEVADAHPGTSGPQDLLGEVLVPDAGIEVGRDDLDHEKYRDRQR